MTNFAFFVVKLYVSLLLSFPHDLHSTCASSPPYSFHIVLPCVPILQNGERGFKATSPTSIAFCFDLISTIRPMIFSSVLEETDY